MIRAGSDGAGLFRYLLEGTGGHLAMLTVLDAGEGLLKLSFSPHQREELLEFLGSARQAVAFEVLGWPFGGASVRQTSNAGPAAGMEDGS
ncbi:MAG: DUF4911 domain-containing protein [Mailhella sp.]|nr:DUF4911 domain-containing protein [Mailhella sp.]